MRTKDDVEKQLEAAANNLAVASAILKDMADLTDRGRSPDSKDLRGVSKALTNVQKSLEGK